MADYIEPQRKKQPNLAEIRKLAFIDLDRALLQILEDTLAFLSASASNIDPMTEKTYLYYKDLLDKKQDS